MCPQHDLFWYVTCFMFRFRSRYVCFVCLGCELMQPQFISSPILTTSAVSDSTIDIHVSVTINTKSHGVGGNTRCAPPPPPLAAAHTTSMLSSSASSSSSSVLLPQLLPPVHPVLSSSPLPAVLYPVPSLSGGACTLADLKKQRSLFRVSSGGGVFDSVDSPHPNSTLRSIKSQNNAISNAFIFTPEAELNATTSPSGNASNGNSSASNTWSSSTKRGKYYCCHINPHLHIMSMVTFYLRSHR